MQRFSHDQILDEIRTLFDWNPPSLSSDRSTVPKLNVPSCFYYDHLDGALSLKEITPMPTLIPNLSATVDRVLKNIKEHNILLSPVLVGDMFPSTEYRKSHIYDDPITDAYSVSEAYERTAHHCALIASMLFLSPSSPSWRSLIKWSEVELGAGANPGLDETHVLHMKEYISDDGINDRAWKSIEGEMLSTLQRVIQRSPTLALWEIFSITPDNEELLEALGESPALIRKIVTEGVSPTISLMRTPDAKQLPWGVSMSSLTSEAPVGSAKVPKRYPSRSSRFAQGAITAQGKVLSEEHAHPFTLPKRSKTKAEPLAGIILKNAWLRAIHKDTTFVIFHCGTLERVAFRHRDSQTLYVSSLIDVAHCMDPGYGKLHIGLYMAIIHDVLDRTRQQPREEVVTPGKQRRHKENAPSPESKRPRTRAVVAKLKADELEHENACNYLTGNATRCDLLLLRMCYGVYNSPSPSIFLRSGRSKKDKMDFEPHEYISVTLTSDIATGAIGVVHGATLKFKFDGSIHGMPVVVKFSMEPDQQKKLRHEYSIYEQLALSHVKGVPRIVGLFKDYNSDILALVMTHTGTSLSSLHPETRFVVGEPQRSNFLRVMSDIHAAGVRHRDIRPENLTINDEGGVFMIDFDMAELSPTEGAKSREVAHLVELLDGRYLPPHEFPSVRTNPRSRGGSVRSVSYSSSHSASSTEEE